MLGIIPVEVYGQTLAFRFISFGRTSRPNQIHLALGPWYLEASIGKPQHRKRTANWIKEAHDLSRDMTQTGGMGM
jgi:hypothetical protein